MADDPLLCTCGHPMSEGDGQEDRHPGYKGKRPCLNCECPDAHPQPHLVTGHYNRAGKPIFDLFEWGYLHERYSYRVVAVTRWNQGGNSYRVSTIWFGIDMGFGMGTPLIFETMVFSSDERVDEWQDRYATEDAARAGHNATVALLKYTAGMKPPAQPVEEGAPGAGGWPGVDA